jgi:hydrogenase maturation protease
VKRVLVAGIGNVLLRDDGFGSEVARRLERSALPEGTRVVDFGIRGLHLAFELLEPLDLLVLVDTTARRGEPGSLYLIDPEVDDVGLPLASPDGHAMDPVSMLAAAKQMGGTLPPTRIVGCEPACLEEGMGLSAPVEGAIEPAMAMIRELLESEAVTS